MTGRLRVAFVAGTLGRGGAEKQLVYMVRALCAVGASVRIYCLTQGEYHEAGLRALGIEVVWIGRRAHPVLRTIALARALRRFRPHVLQSAHAFTNLYVSLVAPLYRCVTIGALRSDVAYELASNGRWTRWLLRLPPGLLANSYVGARNAVAFGARQAKVLVLPNVIGETCAIRATRGTPARPQTVVIGIGTLVPVKRLDRFLRVLAIARAEVGELRGVVVGQGPEEASLVRLAGELGLLPDGVRFVRACDATDVLGSADILLLTSDSEGLPNVLLEAMAAGLPVVTTPAGDAGHVVLDGVTGYVAPFEDTHGMAEYLVRLCRQPDLRRALGAAGRERVQRFYDFGQLAGRLLNVYTRFAEQQRRAHVLKAVRAAAPAAGVLGSA